MVFTISKFHIYWRMHSKIHFESNLRQNPFAQFRTKFSFIAKSKRTKNQPTRSSQDTQIHRKKWKKHENHKLYAMLTGQLIFRVICLHEKKTFEKIKFQINQPKCCAVNRNFGWLNRLPCLLICDFCCCGTFLCGYSGRMLFVSNWVLLHVFGIYLLHWNVSLSIPMGHFIVYFQRWPPMMISYTIHQRHCNRRDIFVLDFGYASTTVQPLEMNLKIISTANRSMTQSLSGFIFVWKIRLFISTEKNWNDNESLAMHLFIGRWHERWVACGNKTPDK